MKFGGRVQDSGPVQYVPVQDLEPKFVTDFDTYVQ